MKIEELEFSARAYNCLRRAGIETVEQLKRMSDEDLMCLRNFGTTCLAEVRRKIAQPAMTNGDRIRRMTDEELAKLMIQITDLDIQIGYCEERPECVAMLDREDGIPSDMCQACMLRWLQRPAYITLSHEAKSQH